MCQIILHKLFFGNKKAFIHLENGFLSFRPERIGTFAYANYISERVASGYQAVQSEI